MHPRTPRLRPILITLALLSSSASVFAQPATPTAADRTEARRHFQSGVASFSHRDWATALEEFQSAYRIAPNPIVRVNIANCLSELGRSVESLHHFEQFLVESPNAPAAQRAEIERHVQDLRGRISEVTLNISPATAPELSPSIDNTAVIPGQATRLAPGHHVVTVSAVGFSPLRREIDSTAGSHDTVEITLTPDAAPPPPPPPSPPPPPPPQPPPPPPPPLPPPPPPLPIEEPQRGLAPGFFYTALGITGAAAVAWGVAGGLALSANSDFDATANAIQGRQGDLAALAAQGHEEAARAHRFALMSDIAMGVTIVGAAASITFLTMTRFGRHAQVAASVTPTGGAVFVGGSF